MLDKTSNTDLHEETEDDTPLGEVPQETDSTPDAETEDDTPLGEVPQETDSTPDAETEDDAGLGETTSKAESVQETSPDNQTDRGIVQKAGDAARNTAVGIGLGIASILPLNPEARQMPPDIASATVQVSEYEKVGQNIERIKEEQETFQGAAEGLSKKNDEDPPPEKQRTEQPLDPPKP